MDLAIPVVLLFFVHMICERIGMRSILSFSSTGAAEDDATPAAEAREDGICGQRARHTDSTMRCETEVWLCTAVSVTVGPSRSSSGAEESTAELRGCYVLDGTVAVDTCSRVTQGIFRLQRQPCDDRVSDLLGPGISTQVPGLDAIHTCSLNRPHDDLACFVLAQPVEHLTRGPKGSDRVGKAHARDVECRPVDRLEHGGHGPGRVDVAGWRDADRAGKSGSEIGEDVGVQICGQDGVERFRLKGHAHRHSVNKHVIHCLEDQYTSNKALRARPHHIGELLGDLLDGFVPQYHTVSHGVRLGHISQHLSGSRLRNLERVAGNPLDPDTREDGHLYLVSHCAH